MSLSLVKGSSMNVILALDTGGTNTDAVLYEPDSGAVLAEAKAATTHHDLALGIVACLEALSRKTDLRALGAGLRSVNLSTTLATNAIAEGYGHRVGLVLVGLDSDQQLVRELLGRLPSVGAVFVDGGHDYYGREERPLDEAALLEKIRPLAPSVSAWAVSSFFSVKNPSHELRAQELIKTLSDKPVTLGRSLTGELGAMRRAATAALNAGLVVIVNRLLDAVAEGLDKMGLSAPVMVVKGDGGLVGEAWARSRPIETVVSGPAAGLVGAMRLARGFFPAERKSMWVLDVGGTTSDLAYLDDGRPAVNRDGARVGRWHTMVEAVDIVTRGLGGDSLVELAQDDELVVGPRRVLPLCRLEAMFPGTVTRAAAGASVHREAPLAFLIPNLPPSPEMSEDETDILDMIDKRGGRPLKISEYQFVCLKEGRLFPGLGALTHPALLASALTPTDCMNVLGLYNCGRMEASYAGVKGLADRLKIGVEELARRVLDKMGQILAGDILTLALTREGLRFQETDLGPDRVLGRMLSTRKGGVVDLSLSLRDPIVLLGAPAQVMAPFVANHTKAAVVSPPGCQVASAVGAAASSVSLVRKVDVSSLPDFSGFRAFLPDGLLDGLKLEDLISDTVEVMTAHMNELARLAGAERESLVAIERTDREVRLNDGTRMVMGATLSFRVTELGRGDKTSAA
ncbi:MAG: hydantoinase/oxoprolinase family protein [Deltaproteobacteria bacterium]|jgi:N-methylhydantoinase A/oxoprolinase/acetone carboxylase beta subunit|nr:hydantoinase/oxoprolinase family protein [Deltaproteobacteria bacterium]